MNRLLKKTGFYGDGAKADEDKDPSQWLWGAVNQLTNTITSNSEEGTFNYLKLLLELLSPSSTGHNYGHILCSDYSILLHNYGEHIM